MPLSLSPGDLGVPDCVRDGRRQPHGVGPEPLDHQLRPPSGAPQRAPGRRHPAAHLLRALPRHHLPIRNHWYAQRGSCCLASLLIPLFIAFISCTFANVSLPSFIDVGFPLKAEDFAPTRQLFASVLTHHPLFLSARAGLFGVVISLLVPITLQILSRRYFAKHWPSVPEADRTPYTTILSGSLVTYPLLAVALAVTAYGFATVKLH